MPDEASDGREALSKLAGSFFHSIVLDLMMPIVSGIDVLRELAADNRWRDSIVVVSAADGIREQVRTLPCVHSVLPKPFDVADLVHHVNSCRLSR
jgi:DNA-binding response OmpR family regulator